MLKQKIYLETEARQIADILDLRKTQDQLLLMDFSGQNGQGIEAYLQKYLKAISADPTINYNKFLSYGWLSNFGLKQASVFEGIKLAIQGANRIPGTKLLLFYDVVEDYLPTFEKVFNQSETVKDYWIFENSSGNLNLNFNSVLIEL